MKIFLTDIYSDKRGIILWGICENDIRKAFIIPFCPWFYILYNKNLDITFKDFFLKFKDFITLNFEKMNDIIKGEVEVLKITCKNPYFFLKIADYIKKSNIPVITEVYNIDLSPVEIFLYSNGIFPFSWIDIDLTRVNNIVFSLENCDSLDYTIPFMKILYIKPDCNGKDPFKMNIIPDILISYEGRDYVVSGDNIDFVDDFIKKTDPDIIICEHGDLIYMKRFQDIGFKNLNRDMKILNIGKEKSYFSYGKIIFKSGFVFLSGRIHIDPENSFFFRETGIEGLIDLSRISCMSLQRVARTSPGTVITSIETKKAFEQNILIPFRKTKAEKIKKASNLINADKGGLSFRPIPGIFENVCELDFFSMYPSIMVNYNLSYETIFCDHKDCKQKLPGTNYKICDKKKGIITESIEFILNRRLITKKRMFEEKNINKKNILNSVQIALKWLLVVSFGYLGYKRARFGRIECHESTTAIGRELLLLSKEIAEENGFRVLHGLTDAIWVQKANASEVEFNDLKNKINNRVNKVFPGIFPNNPGFSINIEGIYKWIVFLKGKIDKIGVPNKYFGVFKDNKVKMRGIHIRRSDTPEFIKNYQQEVFDILKNCDLVIDYNENMSKIYDKTQEYLQRLEQNDFNALELCIVKTISKKAEDYKVNSDISCAVATLANHKITVLPGQKVSFLYVNDKNIKSVPYEVFCDNPQAIDTEKYKKMLFDAESVFILN
ncbi:MAG: hypothetical protein M0R46_15975 [Candidatus Muirbacterium halophilum]|nr:hypothetical protein [Candidatus Muirbacterium halophilum]MCK9477414.1 hypothetical protein [Candidatus Muirbacterium halophilum]